ncbi:MAG: enoyl-CoA hydratase-related protein [Planctomycetota bacterium]
MDYPTTQYIQIETKDGVATITLDRPKANAYDPDFMGHLSNAVAQTDDNPSVKVVLIRSASPKFFCAGADVKAFATNSNEVNQQLVLKARGVVERMRTSGKLFIAVIAGHTLGGGLELAMGCDLRFAAEGEYGLGLPEVKLGLMPGNGGCVALPRLVGRSRAIDLLVTGRMIDPQEAYRLGLVDYLVPADQLEAQARTYANDLAKSAGRAIAEIKQCVYQSVHLDYDAALRAEADAVGKLYDTEDAAEGLRAFTEKREPQFTGR